MLHIPRTLYERVRARSNTEHSLQPEEIDELRNKIHMAIDDAAWITAAHKYFVTEDGKREECIELSIALKLQSDK